MTETTPFKSSHILVPIDMNDPLASNQAITSAVWFARQTAAKISALNVAAPVGKTLNDTADQYRTGFESHIGDLSTRHNCPIQAIFRSHESVDYAIHEVAADLSIDLIIMGTHHPKLTDRLFGSHASKTALNNDCSVMIVRG